MVPEGAVPPSVLVAEKRGGAGIDPEAVTSPGDAILVGLALTDVVCKDLYVDVELEMSLSKSLVLEVCATTAAAAVGVVVAITT